jgi:hypothetical protein
MARANVAIRTTLASLLLVGSGSAFVGTNPAHAAIGACRSDPIVLLSDGTTVQLYSDIYDAPSSVTTVSYVLHAPIGTTVLNVSYPSDMATAIPETFQLIADATDATYHATTFVADANGKVKITTYAIATASTGVVSKTFKHPGKANQIIKLDLKLPR